MSDIPTIPNPPGGGGGGPPPFIVGGRYKILDTLGAGSFGVVYLALDTKLGHEVALKMINRDSPDFAALLRAEFRALRDIAHPNLVRLRKLHVEEEQCFFTMDVVREGQPFTVALQFDRSGPPEEQRAAIRKICRAGFQLADALRTVHDFGECHRDIKPSNVLVTPSGGVFLLDFGMVGHVDRQDFLDTAHGLLVGTLPYVAPEQYELPRILPASDWYSAGIMLYESIAGELPYKGPFKVKYRDEHAAKQQLPPPLARAVPAVPEAVDRLISSLLSPVFEQRPSAEDVCARLRELGDEPGARVYWSSHRADVQRYFVARDEELKTLRRAYDDAVKGSFV
ncbi:MAG: serine/threonine-protein kinase, partial [Minicystis sp.]